MATVPRVAAGGCARGLLLQLLFMGGALALLPVCGVLAAVVPMPREARPFTVVFALVAWMVTVLGGVTMFGVLNRARIRRRVDAGFAPLGLDGASFLSIGRQYHGEYRGRRVDAFFHRGPRVEVLVGARAGTRMAIAPSDNLVNAVYGVAGMVGLAADSRFSLPELGPVSVLADDPAWARRLCADPDARAAITRLLDAGDRPETRVVAVRPGAVSLGVRGVDVSVADDVAGATDTLIALAGAVEAQPAPAAWQEPSARELRMRRRQPGAGFLLWVAAGTVVFVLGLSAVTAGFVFLFDR